AFNWVEKKSSIAMLKYKNPNLVIPSHHTLEGHVIKNATQKLYLELALKAINDNIGVLLAFDGWKNILKQNIFETVLITSSGEVLIWNVKDISIELERTINIMFKVEKLLKELKDQQIKEQPLLILSFLLYPDICLTRFKLPINGITYAEIGKWIIYYYCAWFGNSPKKIIAKLQDYQDELFPFSKNEWNFFKGVILNVSIERLFSSIGFFHTKTRNWLSSRVLDTWFSMIEDKENTNQLYYENDELDMTNSTTSQNLLNTTHSTDNQSAKWQLEDLFVTDLIILHYIIETEKHKTLKK
ncbi:17122_t:CDS:2, partial [Cetraspora pellucida]